MDVISAPYGLRRVPSQGPTAHARPSPGLKHRHSARNGARACPPRPNGNMPPADRRAESYPWGNEFADENVVYNDNQTADVGSRPGGASWVGALDLSGNVWEWVANWYEEPYPAQSQVNPSGKASGDPRTGAAARILTRSILCRKQSELAACYCRGDTCVALGRACPAPTIMPCLAAFSISSRATTRGMSEPSYSTNLIGSSAAPRASE